MTKNVTATAYAITAVGTGGTYNSAEPNGSTTIDITGTGFGATLKNIGMGLGSRAGKLAMHKAFDLTIDKIDF